MTAAQTKAWGHRALPVSGVGAGDGILRANWLRGAFVPKPAPSLALPFCPDEEGTERGSLTPWSSRAPSLWPRISAPRAGQGTTTNVSLWGFLSLLRFPSNLLFTSASGELWKMVRIGGQPLGFGESRGAPHRCGGWGA